MANVVAQLPSEITQFADQVRIRLTSQLIKGFSRALQILRKYFNDAAIFAYIISSLLVLSKNFDLNINDSDSVVTLFGSSLKN